VNIDIKVGDKLFSKISKELIEKNKYYKINTITDSANKIFEKIFEKNIEIKISIFVGINITNTSTTTFILNEPNHEYYIWNYFYTPNELRKEKIKKLNE
jgi:hypothetical protein